MRILAINTYAGSLLAGASELPHAEIIGSYEDKAFFQPVAKANFPWVEHKPYRRDWPNHDLSDTIVVAHPPCSAFSVQNGGGAEAKGVDSPAFFCTKQVLDYAMPNKALAICIESVIGALPGAWIVHEYYARQHGYDCYRILENGCMFGAQWRERFWAVWIRRGAAPKEWAIELTPQFQTVKEVLMGHEDGPTCPGLDKALDRLKQRLLEEAKLTPEQMSFLFEPQDPPHPTTWIIEVIWKNIINKAGDLFPEEKWYLHQDYLGGAFSTSVMKYIDPNGTAPVLLADSFWYYNGRVLSEAGYKRLMGFPADYKFPVGRKNYRNLMRMGLSKGVMPPIVTWLLDELGAHLGMHGRKVSLNKHRYVLTCLPEHIVDFRIRKEDWVNRHKSLPELRHYDDERAVKTAKVRKRVVA